LQRKVLTVSIAPCHFELRGLSGGLPADGLPVLDSELPGEK